MIPSGSERRDWELSVDDERLPQTIEVSLISALAGERIDRAIAQSLYQLGFFTEVPSVRRIKQWIEEGGVRFRDDGLCRRLRPSLRAIGGEVLICKLNMLKEDLQPAQKTHLQDQGQYWQKVWSAARDCNENIEVIAQEEGWIIVNKPTGIPTAPTIDPSRESLYHRALNFLSAARGDDHSILQERPPYLRVIHRLDRDTSGAVILSRSREATRVLSTSFARRDVEKRYLLVCRRPRFGPLKDFLDLHTTGLNGRLILPQINHSLSHLLSERRGEMAPLISDLPILVCDDDIDQMEPHHDGRMRWGALKRSEVSASVTRRSAQTEFRVLWEGERSLCVEARPQTGRTHQIRVHLRAMDAPLVGDELYEGPPAKRLALHAWRLSLPALEGGGEISAIAPIPVDFWPSELLV